MATKPKSIGQKLRASKKEEVKARFIFSYDPKNLKDEKKLKTWLLQLFPHSKQIPHTSTAWIVYAYPNLFQTAVVSVLNHFIEKADRNKFSLITL